MVKKSRKISDTDQLKVSSIYNEQTRSFPFQVNAFLMKLDEWYLADRSPGRCGEKDGNMLSAQALDPERSARLTALLNSFKPNERYATPAYSFA